MEITESIAALIAISFVPNTATIKSHPGFEAKCLSSYRHLMFHFSALLKPLQMVSRFEASVIRKVPSLAVHFRNTRSAIHLDSVLVTLEPRSSATVSTSRDNAQRIGAMPRSKSRAFPTHLWTTSLNVHSDSLSSTASTIKAKYVFL